MKAKNTMGRVIVVLFLITLLPLHTALAGVREYINKGVSWAKGTGSKVITNYTTPAYKYITTSRTASFVAGTAASVYNKYGRPALNDYVRPALRSGLNIITLSQPAGASTSKPMNQSAIDNIFNVTVDGKNYTGVKSSLSERNKPLNSSEENKLKTRVEKSLADVKNNGTLTTINSGLQTGKINSPTVGNNNPANSVISPQNNTRPLAPLALPNLSVDDANVTFPFFPATYTGNSTVDTGIPGVDALRRLVSAHPVQGPSIASTASIAEEVLVQINPASLNNSANLMGEYLNNGRRKSDPTVYNPKYDTRIDSNSSAFTNQINPASLNNKKGVLYYNDGTQYGYRSIRNPEYVSANANNPSTAVAASDDPKNQINLNSLNHPMGPYYNDGTRYGDRRIKNPVYDIYKDHK